MRLSLIFGLSILTSVTTAIASETKRDLAAHEHGVGKLNIAFEKSEIAMELEAPGADIVGFEHHAESTEDRKKVDAAIAVLAKPLDIFALPVDAKCQVKEANVELHGGDEDKHHDEHAAAEKHEEHANEKHDDHADAKHNEHGNEEAASHTEFHAEYVLSCANPSAVTKIEFPYFTTFPNAKELEVQMISDKGTNGFEVERDEPRLDLSGMI